MAAIVLRREDERTKALRDTMSELLGLDESRKRFAANLSGLDVHYDLGDGHPLLGRRMPDLDLVTTNGPLRVFTLLHGARPVLLNLGEPGSIDITRWQDRVRLADAEYEGAWELPALGAVTAPTAVLIRPDGYVAWVGDQTQLGLADATYDLVRSRPPFEDHERLTLIESLAVFPSPPVNVAVHFPRASGTTLYAAAPSPLRLEVSVAIPLQPLAVNAPP